MQMKNAVGDVQHNIDLHESIEKNRRVTISPSMNESNKDYFFAQRRRLFLQKHVQRAGASSDNRKSEKNCFENIKSDVAYCECDNKQQQQQQYKQ